MNGQKGIDHAVDLHEGYRLFPLGSEQGGHERGSETGEERHRGGDQERRGLEGAAHQALHAGAVVLHAGDRRQHDRLNGSIQHRPDRLRILLALRDQAELGGRELLAHDEVSEALVALVEEPRGQKPPPEAEELARPVGPEDRPGPPVHLEREDGAVDELVGELLGDERPEARAGERRADAGGRGRGDGDHRRPEDLPHLEVARHLGDLDCVVGVDDQEQPEGAQRPDDAGHRVEGRNGGRGEEDHRVQSDGHREAHPEDRREIRVVRLRRLDEGGVEPGLHDDVAQVHEDEHDSERTELLGGEKSGHDDLDDKFH